MSRSSAIGSEPKYYTLKDEIYGHRQLPTYTEIKLGEKKEGSALNFLQHLHRKIEDGVEIRIDTKSKSLNPVANVVDAVVAGCDAKVGILLKIANVFFRILSFFGLKKYTPTIDLIHHHADKIQKIEMVDGFSIFAYRKKLQEITDFFATLPKEPAQKFFGPDFPKEFKSGTIRECLDTAKVLQPFFTEYDQAHLAKRDQSVDADNFFPMQRYQVENMASNFNWMNAHSIQYEFAVGNYVVAAQAASKLNHPYGYFGKGFFADLAKKCMEIKDIASAHLALSALPLGDRLELETKLAIPSLNSVS